MKGGEDLSQYTRSPLPLDTLIITIIITHFPIMRRTFNSRIDIQKVGGRGSSGIISVWKSVTATVTRTMP